MTRVAALLACALVGAGLGGSASRGAPAPPALAKASRVLAIVPAYNGSRLAWLDPGTLRPLKRPSTALPGGAWSPVVSPAGRLVALGGVGSTGVRIVDVRRMKVTARVARDSAGRYVRPLAWPTPRRLLLLDYPQNARGAPDALVAVDPVTGRVVERTVRASSGRAWTHWAAAGRQLVVLSQETARLGAARIVVFGPSGGILRAKDLEIAGGHWPDGPPSSQLADPGLAVDPSGRNAFIVDAQGVTSVDLDSLDTSYAQLTAPRSLASRILDWLEPTAQAKLLAGFAREATWIDGLLATSGAEYHGARSTPAGLQLVDPGTGTTRVLEPRATAHGVSQGLLLAYGGELDAHGPSETGMGLAAFAADGRHLWTALAGEPVWHVETAGGYAYVPTPETTFPAGVRVIDLATGAVLRTVRQELPSFVTES